MSDIVDWNCVSSYTIIVGFQINMIICKTAKNQEEKRECTSKYKKMILQTLQKIGCIVIYVTQQTI